MATARRAPEPLVPAHALLLPPFARGMRIGLLGGSFNPAHEAHVMISQTALRRLGLDAVWWLVTPGNPLKDNQALPPWQVRLAAARALVKHPRIKISAIEVRIGTPFTFATLSWLVRRAAGVHFVWLMGGDNLANFHQWQRWRDLAWLMPVAVIDRPGATLRAAQTRAGQVLARYQMDETDAGLLATAPTPAFVYLHGRRSALSSTQLRMAAASALKLT